MQSDRLDDLVYVAAVGLLKQLHLNGFFSTLLCYHILSIIAAHCRISSQIIIYCSLVFSILMFPLLVFLYLSYFSVHHYLHCVTSVLFVSAVLVYKLVAW